MSNAVHAPDFKKLFETAPGLFLVLLPDAPDFTVVAVSEAYLRASRRKRSEIVGRSLFVAFSKDHQNPYSPLKNGDEALRSSLRRAMSSRVPDKMAEQTDGAHRSDENGFEQKAKFWSALNTPVFSDSGQVINVIHSIENTSFFDVNQKNGIRKELDQNLNAPKISDENDRLILDSLTDYAIYLLDSSGSIRSWNAGAEKIKGYLASEVIGKSISIFYSMDDVKTGKPIRDLWIAETQGKFEEEATCLRKDGTGFRASVAITSIYDKKGPLKGFVTVVRQISSEHEGSQHLVEARKMLEAQVMERTQDLLRSNIELEQFAYVASHDLQTPLRHISSYVQLLTNKIRKTTVLDAKSEQWIQYILSGTKHMKSLISDLLSYSRIGRADINVEEIDTAKLLAHVVDELREPIRATNAKIVTGELPKIFGIKSQIEQLFQNLIENAIKFKKPDEDPIVSISFKDLGEFWKFSVSDNGVGIDLKYSERIFLMFHRLHSHDEYEGTGIGLAICRKIVEFHGGKIELDAGINEGAVFSFTLLKNERVTSSSGTKVGGPQKSKSFLIEPREKEFP